ncbi:10202_t:CDS:2, partial [Scutellospora calospora]
LTGNYNEVFFAIQAKYRKNLYDEQAEDIKKFDKALESQPREVVGFFVTTIDFSTESKEAALNSKRKIFLCNTDNIVSKIKSLSLVKEKVYKKNVILDDKEQSLKPSVNYLKQLKEVKNIIDKWENNGWRGQNNQELKAPRKLCNEINELLKKKINVTFYYLKNQN